MEITFTEVDKKNQHLVVEYFVDRSYVGKPVLLSINQHVNVKRARGIDSNKQIFTKILKVRKVGSNTVRIPLKKIKAYTYDGHDISLMTEVELTKRESMFSFFKNNKRSVQLGFFKAPRSTAKANVMLNPPDKFNIFKNISVLSKENKIYFYKVSISAVVIIALNTLLGWHDQNAEVGSTYFYSHYNSENEQQSPLFSALRLDAALIFGFGIWLKMILKKYMTFRLVGKLGEVSLGKRYSLRRLLRGKSRVDLEACELRVVACNIECGQYITKSDEEEKIESFYTPVKCVSIYRKYLDHIPKERDLSQYLTDEICFDKVYQDLAPTCMTSPDHGIALHWEVQLLHPDLVDHEAVGSSDGFHFGRFVLDDNHS